ncbi:PEPTIDYLPROLYL ISOMERASE [Salix purpurea]|uniref:peptidylprolyl isomerase n=1 Tax=Salix purpurea TaxID=77065 RepID=A0A9Q0Z1J2_SALPP|nr:PEPTIDYLPROLYL ISOMERASE [Salix purpurea]KAJ6717916.1 PEPTIDYLPROLYL ISOMERASE [Salix purpurea]
MGDCGENHEGWRGCKNYLQTRFSYGSAGSLPDIPPGATLIFEVELVACKPRKGSSVTSVSEERARLEELKKQREVVAAAKEEEKKRREEAKAAAAARIQAKLESKKRSGEGKGESKIRLCCC